MNVCMLARSTLAHRAGGMEVVLDGLSRGLARRGHAVTVVTSAAPAGAPAPPADGVAIRYLPGVRDDRYSRAWWAASARAVTALHRDRPIDVVWSHSVSAYGYVTRARRRLRLPLVVRLPGTLLGEWRSALRAIRSPRDAARFALWTAPRDLAHALPQHWRTLRAAAAVIAVSQALGEDLAHEYRLDRQRIRVVPNGADTERFVPDPLAGLAVRRRYGIPPSAPLVLMVGRIHRQKGIDRGVECFAGIRARVPCARLLVIGDGPALAEVRALAGRLGLAAAAVFCGEIANGDLPGYYAAGDLLLNPTIREEASSQMLPEAMACGLPLLTTDVLGLPEFVLDGVNGFVVAREALADMTEQATRILTDPALAAALGRGARKVAVERFSLDAMVDGILEVFAAVVSDRRPREGSP
jgi:glycosyltransferase involved in cell wall biosynthesis